MASHKHNRKHNGRVANIVCGFPTDQPSNRRTVKKCKDIEVNKGKGGKKRKGAKYDCK